MGFKNRVLEHEKERETYGALAKGFKDKARKFSWAARITQVHRSEAKVITI